MALSKANRSLIVATLDAVPTDGQNICFRPDDLDRLLDAARAMGKLSAEIAESAREEESA